MWNEVDVAYLKVLSLNWPGKGWRKPMKFHSHDSRWPSQESNLALPEHKSEAETAETTCPVTNSVYFFGGVSWGGVRLSPPGTSATDLLYQPRTIDECAAIGGMRIGRGNRSTRRKPAPVPLCPPQIPHDLTWTRTRAAAVGRRQLTVWAMARPR
jgi:hypothetical protein